MALLKYRKYIKRQSQLYEPVTEQRYMAVLKGLWDMTDTEKLLLELTADTKYGVYTLM